ncbi:MULTISPECIES: YciI family protein [Dyella]|uniref:YciI family protein n=2 Tax=Dyella TaxID=231454 RepID=A0A4R0YRG7_9GAMM|nr:MULTISPECIES: YciI family protein [Dyella]TBR40524.1 YciI family protein [Dyella terrae]TCI11895.1 YciI family protein [Dyella soli]
MRVMVMVKATEVTERGGPIDPAGLEAMSRFNEELAQAGKLVALGGLTPTSNGKRVAVDGERRIVTDGPFTETKELVAGFMILEVESMEEAMDWVLRAPNCSPVRTEIEVRPLMGMAEFEAVQNAQTKVIRERMRERLNGS